MRIVYFYFFNILYHNHISKDIAIFYMFASVMQYVSLYMLAVLVTQLDNCIVP